MSNTVAPGHDEPAFGLTVFQWDLLAVLDANGPCIGQDAKHALEAHYDAEVNHGRLYPNLDELVEQGLVSKRPRNRRSNTYSVTGRGARELAARRDWLGGDGE